jgi:bifunctional oligoribonuclease and PAP phosphatase NrnA
VTTNGNRSSRDRVLAELRDADKLVVVAHENPDGDAIGSLVAMRGILAEIGKDCLMFIAERDLPLPQEYSFIGLDGLVSEPPADVSKRTIVFLDCGNIERNPAEAFRPEGGVGSHILNLDHHHDNTHFGTVNLVVPEASCTAEIVWELMNDLGVSLTPAIADALYVGLITDTGRFMYENTGVQAHLMAADLIAAGVDVHAIYRHVYEGVPYGKLALLARGLANVQRFDDGRLTITDLSVGDFSDSDAQESYSEGLIDHLRAVQGTRLAALVRDRLGDPPNGGRKVSLRAADDGIDVSAIARAQGGGGHRQAAGFSTELSYEELVSFLREQLAAQT